MMKRFLTIMVLAAAAFAAVSCAGFLDPLPNGSYNETNYDKYPALIRGYVEKAYDLLPGHYIVADFIGGDGLSDNMTWRAHTSTMYMLATGSAQMNSYNFSSLYNRDYKAIYYCNLFLDNDLGKNTRYMLDAEANAKLQRALQGDAYGLRAFYYWDLLKFFGGRSVSGEMLGVPVFTKPVDLATADMADVKRESYAECVKQIIADCDSAYKYLPLANRDFLKDPEMIPVLGAVRWRRLDGASILALKAMVLLSWASPAFNPTDDLSRWDAAAKAAKAAIDFKMNVDNVPGGFNPNQSFLWHDPNSPEAYFISQISQNSTYENAFYPNGFNGSGDYGPTQELVDAFPMANGYPIDHPLSTYNPSDPYRNRDPRFYADIFYNGSQVVRNTNTSDIMYTFDTTEGGYDAPGLIKTSPTGYYIKKFVFTGWNKNDNTVQTAQKCIFFFRWTHMLLAFAEAANQVVGPLDEGTYGMSAKQAIAYIRNRPLEDGSKGVGALGDPYLDECATAGFRQFDKLVRNEWRIETCFEGHRFHNVRRWARSVDEINVPIHRIKIVRNGTTLTYTPELLEQRIYPSLWLPIPYMEVRKAPGIEQNQGWENWK